MRTFKEILKQAQLIYEKFQELGKDWDKKSIRIWSFKDAPEELRALSENGGDEDWIALIPDELYESGNYWWLERCANFIEYHPIPGFVVCIGSHS